MPIVNTVSDAQNTVQHLLEALPKLLRNLTTNEEIASALQFLAPEGYVPVVEFEEDGRKKKKNAAVSNLNPETVEIRIYFEEKQHATPSVTTFKPAPAPVSSIRAATSFPQEQVARTFGSPPVTEPVSATEVAQCCQALDQAEKLGRHFIAIKWFRDVYLTEQGYSWIASDRRRQQVLAHAIDVGRIQSKKIPNPRSPQFPTTTITLNRSVATPAIAPRFQPIPVRGEPVSSTLIRDRGTF